MAMLAFDGTTIDNDVVPRDPAFDPFLSMTIVRSHLPIAPSTHAVTSSPFPMSCSFPIRSFGYRSFLTVVLKAWLWVVCIASCKLALSQTAPTIANALAADLETDFQTIAVPFLNRYCLSCHNETERESGIRVDDLNASIPDSVIGLWEGIRNQVDSGAMPPEAEPQPTEIEREALSRFIEHAVHLARSREVPRNGSMRRLTVAQYDTTLKQLLQIGEHLIDQLPPDAVSKDGFTNNAATLQLSPLQLEAYFQIAETALSLATVDPSHPPILQHFRMQLGKNINPDPCRDNLVLGALNHLLPSTDFIVDEPELHKPFAYTPFRMQRQFRFIEGYQGNDTVRAWRDFDSIYHAVFACMRGSEGYPKGQAYETVPNGLLLRPAIPSTEIFGESSTYGPHANFKISLRELPDRGRFRVTVQAAKWPDGLLLDAKLPSGDDSDEIVHSLHGSDVAEADIEIPDDGIYRLDVHLPLKGKRSAQTDSSRLDQGLSARWSFDTSADGKASDGIIPTKLDGGARFEASPFGHALWMDGTDDCAIADTDPRLLVGSGDFTVAAWINPRGLRQAGIVALGSYNYTHGWILDMPDGRGVLRLETANADGEHNGSVLSPPGILKDNQWQHVAVVVRRGEANTRLLVNGFEVAQGTINASDLSNPQLQLHIGRVPGFQQFAGEIDEVYIYHRALEDCEIAALVEPGKELAFPPTPDAAPETTLSLQQSSPQALQFRSAWTQPAFAAVRLEAGPLHLQAALAGSSSIDRIDVVRIKPSSPLGTRFEAFEARQPTLGVHLGLRRDCGSTLSQVGEPQSVDSTNLKQYVFEGSISNFPSPDVEKDNVNYLAGIREIGIRSEYTDGRDMPRLLIHSVEFEGPFYDQWPPASHRNLFIDSPRQNEPETYAGEILSSFASKAFRRPIDGPEVQAWVHRWQSEYRATGDFQQSILSTLQVMLTSPQFLYLIETSQDPQAEPIDDWELASKLSYFLWNGPPDRELIELARHGGLRDALDLQVDRMINDPRFRNFTDQFASQWLSLDKFDVVEIDAKQFPKLNRDTKQALRSEPARFLQYLVQNNAPVSQLLRSDFIVANEVVATYYGLGSQLESGFSFVPIQHHQSHLGGVITQAAVLAGLSDGRDSNPVKRGAWFARRIIAEPPEDPPPNVPKLEDLTQLSIRERLARHRDVPGCIKCHTGIDPWGLPFEQFNAAGLAKQVATDSTSDLPDGSHIDDFESLREYLIRDRLDAVTSSWLKHLSAYACGRSLAYNELAFLKESSPKLVAEGLGLKDLIRWVIHSDPFLMK